MWYEWENEIINLNEISHITYEKIRFVNQKEGLEITFHFHDHNCKIRYTGSEWRKEFEKIRNKIGLKDKKDVV